jgi:YHS domain-containing protein
MHRIDVRRNEMANPSDCRKILIWALFTIGFLSFSDVAVTAADKPATKVYGVAIKGYDPVAYFTDGRAVKGKSEYSYNWNEARWYFSKPENRDLFAANPKKYAPNHEGF